MQASPRIYGQITTSNKFIFRNIVFNCKKRPTRTLTPTELNIYLSNTTTSVGARLPAMALDQALIFQLNHRYRGQARSYRVYIRCKTALRQVY